MDHPRSRGVYLKEADRLAQERGSSPLARGLRRPECHRDRRRRIIPARAGFTSTYRAGRPPYPDHPRSRGVYLVIMSVLIVLSGSSPLARGLRATPLERELETRIIPARAGFTNTMRCALICAMDHPRSRGVYPVGLVEKSLVKGSSPLARGLLEHGLQAS